MIAWFFYGAIFNLIYYYFGWDIFVVRVTLMNLDSAEENLGHLIDEDAKDKIKELKKNCEDYGSSFEHNMFTIVLDLILYPLYALAFLVALMDYFILKDKK